MTKILKKVYATFLLCAILNNAFMHGRSRLENIMVAFLTVTAFASHGYAHIVNDHCRDLQSELNQKNNQLKEKDRLIKSQVAQIATNDLTIREFADALRRESRLCHEEQEDSHDIAEIIS
jgi:formate/nitrite transporter FocA (FNT family)